MDKLHEAQFFYLILKRGLLALICAALCLLSIGSLEPSTLNKILKLSFYLISFEFFDAFFQLFT